MGVSHNEKRADGTRAGGALADPRAGWLERTCAHLPYSLLLLESDLTVHMQLGRALQAGLPVQVRAGRLVLPSLIRRRVCLLLSGNTAGPALIRAHEPGGSAAALVFERACADEPAPLWRVAVFAEDAVLPSAGALRLAYLMTPSEAGVVRQLVAGRCLRAAAQHLGISHETARAHLKSAFLKANVRCQAALVARVLAGPAIVLGQDRLAGQSPLLC